MILFNFVSIKAGGGQQNTLSFLQNIKFDFVPSDGTFLTGVVLSQSDYVGLQYKKDPRKNLVEFKNKISQSLVLLHIRQSKN